MILYQSDKKPFWLKTLVLVFFSLVVIANLVFLVKPENFYHLSFGDFQVSSYRQGLGIFENHRFHNFYNFSSYNDYLIINDQKINLLSTDKNQTAPKIKFSPSWYDLAVQVFKNYFFFPAVNYSLQNENIKVNYRAEKITDQCLAITKTISIKEQKDLQKIGTTFSFNSTDFVFSPFTFQLYSNNSQKDTDVFISTYQQALLTSSIYTEPISINESKVALKNLDNSGFLLFQTDSSQKFIIDQPNRLLILETPLSGNFATIHFTICSFSSLAALKEASL